MYGHIIDMYKFVKPRYPPFEVVLEPVLIDQNLALDSCFDAFS